MSVSMFDLAVAPIGEVLEAVGTAQGLLIGSPTILGDTLPPVWQLLCSLNPVVHRNLKAGCFGSYGWSADATKNISQRFSQLHFIQPLSPLDINFNPSKTECLYAIEFGKNFAERL